ncbi:MAG: ABC transporter ATP-binding protein [bacterium]
MSFYSIKVENLSKAYKIYQKSFNRLKEWLTSGRSYHEKLWALKNVSFQVQAGETIGIIGSNGAGKTTLLKILTGTAVPTSGRVAMTGRTASLLELGIGFHPHLTGRENVVFNGRILGLTEAELAKKIDEIISFSELSSLIDLPLRTYSSGMCVRLGFAIASCLEPEIFIIDEILSVGDLAFQQKCIERIQDLVRKGKTTFIIVSHNLSLLQMLTNRIMWLDGGKIVQIGEPATVIRNYEIATLENKADIYNPWSTTHNLNGPAKNEPGYTSGNIKLTAVEFLDHTGKVSNKFETTQPMTIRLKIKNDKTTPIRKPIFSIIIYSENGVQACAVSNYSNCRYSYPILNVSSEDIIEYKIDHLPLERGTYYLSAYVFDGPDEPFWLKPADAHVKRYPFVVWSDFTAHGVTTLPGKWRHICNHEF